MKVATLAVVVAALLVTVLAGLSLVSNQAAAQTVYPASVAVANASVNRYYLVVVPRDSDGSVYDRYLIDSRDGRVWVWPSQEPREFVQVPTVEKPSAEK